jgi:hypothetical protein
VTASRNSYIYALSDPITGHVRYVGQAVNIRTRRNKHIHEAKLCRNHKECWIHGLRLKNLSPIIWELDCVPKDAVNFWEEHYIFLFRSWGFDLTNRELFIVRKSPTPLTKKMMSETKLNQWKDTGYKDRQAGAIRLGIKRDWDQIRPIFSDNAKIYLQNPEVRRRAIEGIRRSLNTPEYKKLRSVISIKAWASLSNSEREERISKFKSNESERRASCLAAVQKKEYRENHSVLLRKRHAKGFSVYNKKTGELIGSWCNIIACANEMNLRSANISAVLHGRAKSTKGYVAKFHESKANAA